MEADWEVEIGSGAACIEAGWSGLVDLQHQPERITEIVEARHYPPLADALLRLNAQTPGTPSPAVPAPVWTAKCDFWDVADLDPDEMEATPAETLAGLACYIDLLPRQGLVFRNLEAAESWAREVSSRLRSIPARCCRIDLVIRQAVEGNHQGLGITAYISACGPDSSMAKTCLATALNCLVRSIISEPELLS